MPSTFVHPLVHTTSSRSSKSRSPSTPSDPSILAQAEDGSSNERQAKRPRTTSKEKSPVKEQPTIKEEDEHNPP